MQSSTASTTKAIIALLLTFSTSTSAADCFTINGVNTQQLGQTNLAVEIDSTCADLRSGVPRQYSTSNDEVFSVRASSSQATYEFCEIALENIAVQCADFVLGKFDFDFGGNKEHYEVQGHADNPGDLGCKADRDGPQDPENEGDDCH